MVIGDSDKGRRPTEQVCATLLFAPWSFHGRRPFVLPSPVFVVFVVVAVFSLFIYSFVASFSIFLFFLLASFLWPPPCEIPSPRVNLPQVVVSTAIVEKPVLEENFFKFPLFSDDVIAGRCFVLFFRYSRLYIRVYMYLSSVII